MVVPQETTTGSVLDPMTLVVQKFGGTSVADPAAIRRLIEIVRAARTRDGRGPAVVVSAMSGVTDGLLGVAASAGDSHLEEALSTTRLIRDRHIATWRNQAKRDLCSHRAQRRLLQVSQFNSARCANKYKVSEDDIARERNIQLASGLRGVVKIVFLTPRRMRCRRCRPSVHPP